MRFWLRVDGVRIIWYFEKGRLSYNNYLAASRRGEAPLFNMSFSVAEVREKSGRESGRGRWHLRLCCWCVDCTDKYPPACPMPVQVLVRVHGVGIIWYFEKRRLSYNNNNINKIT
jgi:hypothetical protein